MGNFIMRGPVMCLPPKKEYFSTQSHLYVCRNWGVGGEEISGEGFITEMHTQCAPLHSFTFDFYYLNACYIENHYVLIKFIFLIY